MADQPAVVEAALRFLKHAKATSQKQRERERNALRFQVPEHQWDDDARAARGKTTIDGVEIPGRPILSIPKLNQPIQLILNQEKSAHLGVNVSPLNEDATDETAEVIRDLYRREEQRSRAGLARSWGFDRAVKAGFGCYRINTVFDDESSNPFDQRITWQRILYQDAVYFDPSAEEPDWSDGQEALVGSFMRASVYKRSYPKSQLAQSAEGELAEVFENAPDWVQIAEEDGKEHAYLVAEYFRKEYTPKVWVVLDNGSFSYEDEIPDGRSVHPDPKVGKRREIQVPTVVWSKINALEELETEELNGKYIPLIPVVGIELQPFDAERRWQGLIEPAMDGQKMFNYAASNAIETAALEPRARYHIYEGQDEGYEEMWQQANIRNFPLLKTKIVQLPGGSIAPPPTLLQTDTSKLAMSMQLLQEADNFIQASTSTFDPSLGRLPTKDRSGKAILALQEQSDAGNSHFLHNLATVTLPYEAKVVLDLMGKIYDRPGRVAQLLDGEDTERTVMLNAPFTVDPKTKRPKRVQCPGPNGHMQFAECGDSRVPGDAKTYDLRKGAYGHAVTIGKSWQTRLQQGEAEIGQILQSNPGLMPLVGPTYFKFRDFPGSKEIAELLKKMRAQQYPFLEQKEGEQDPQQAQAQLQQMQQQMQMLQQQLQQAGQIIQTKQIEQGAKVEGEKAKALATVEIEKAKGQLAVELQRMKDATAIRIAEINAMVKGVTLDQEQEHEALAFGEELKHDAMQAAANRSHEWDMAEEAHGRAQQMADQGHQQARDLAEQQAALAPPPNGQPGEEPPA